MLRRAPLLVFALPAVAVAGVVLQAVVTETAEETHIRPVAHTAAVRKAVSAVEPSLRACGDQAIAAQESLRTTLTFRWSVQNGKVVNLEVVAPARADQALADCFAAALRGLRVPGVNAEVLSMGWELDARATTAAGSP